MTSTALFFLALSIVLVWGGLVVSILNLRRDGRPGATSDRYAAGRGDEIEPDDHQG